MTSIREISGNTINNATIIQGDFNTTHTGPSDTGDSFLHKISKTDPFYDKERILELKGPFLYESFSWILDHEDFQKWRHTKKSGYPVCIVDALDECEHDCKLLLSLIVKTSGRVKWLLSSRNIKDIERGFRSIEPSRRLSLELKENAENVSKSVDTYINKSIQDIEALEDDEELQTRTTETLRKKANGTFLWVTLVIEQLRNTDHRHVEEVVDQMPEGLENLYDLMIQRANSKLRQKDREACRILLSIVTTAERPLHLKELHVFICSQWEHYKVDYNMRDMKDMVKDLGSLLSIRDETVYFIHQITDFDLSHDAAIFVMVLNENVIIGDTRTGQLLFNIKVTNDGTYVDGAFFLNRYWPNYSLLASVDSSNIRIWRVDTSDTSAERYTTRSVMISPGSTYVATGNPEGSINIWDGTSGECVQVLKRDDSNAPSPVFSPNSELIACKEGEQNDVRIWHLNTGKLIRLLEGQSKYSIYEMAFSDDSKYLVIGYSSAVVKVWCVESGKCLFGTDEISDDEPEKWHISFISWLAISACSTYIAVVSVSWNGDSKVCILDWRAGRGVSSFELELRECRRIDSVTFSSDATVLAVICHAGWKNETSLYETQIWGVAAGVRLARVAIGPSRSPPVFTPIANQLLTDRANFCKTSSWELWNEIPRQVYGIVGSWITFGGEKVLGIPKELQPYPNADSAVVSGSLLAYTTRTYDIVIIRVPSQHGAQTLAIKPLVSDDISDTTSDSDNSSAGGVSCIVDGESDSDEVQD
ncbi:hypothetical protein TrVGV298_007416 [Trichoderma virens]|nr:hypothetical protein TrVGV298_007416 [Trichoderma virens]